VTPEADTRDEDDMNVETELPQIVTADADEITLGRQSFNDSDKSNYFE
jgi:hypothetical protein